MNVMKMGNINKMYIHPINFIINLMFIIILVKYF